MKRKYSQFIQKFIILISMRFVKLMVLMFLSVSMLSVSTASAATLSNIQQKHTITGKVTDVKGTPLPGITIVVKGTTIGTTTNENGYFSLEVSSVPVNLEFSFIGMKTQDVVADGKTSLKIVMQESALGLNEVVVTALGVKRQERALGYSVQEVPGKTLQTVQGVNVATSLTGQVSGLMVANSTEFTQAPTIELRGETNILIVVNGVPSPNVTLRDIPADNIKSISVLKGATASALYGALGQNGAIMITTKDGSSAETGLTVSVNTSNMFTAGFLAIPKVQTTFGRKLVTATNTYTRSVGGSWGIPMDGREIIQWDPVSKSLKLMPYLPLGKNNFRNFLQQGFIMNNNVSVTSNGKYGSLRASASWLRNKGQYPNSMFNVYTYALSGEMKINKFSLTSSMSYTYQNTPNMGFRGYTGYNPMYSMLIWGAQDYDIQQYKDYWLVPNESQNDSYTASINNPYFNAYQRTHSESRNVFNGSATMKYDLTSWLKATYRIGFDTYNDKQEVIISQGSLVSAGATKVLLNGSQIWGESKKGSYNVGLGRGYSVNTDFLLSADKKFNDIRVSGFFGGSIYYKQDEGIEAFTRGGLSIPGFYSLAASVNPIKVDSKIYKQQLNSLYGQAAVSWKSMLYLDATVRNDWSSTMPLSTRSYMYPSVSGSFVISELLPKMNWLSFWKLRASWTTSKTPAGIYSVIPVYSIDNNAWGNLNSASYPTTITGNDVKPDTYATWELGTTVNVFKNRGSLDVAVYRKRHYNFLVATNVDPASGFLKNYINTNEERVRKGVEITAHATPIKNKDWTWNLAFNWSTSAEYYLKLDSIYSPDNPWTKVGKRTDALTLYNFQKDPNGNIIFSNGLPQFSKYASKYGNWGPKWIWGIASNLTYKNWTFTITFDGRVGGLLPSTTEMYMWVSGAHPNSVVAARFLDQKNPGSSNYIGKGVMVTSGTVTYDSYGNITSDTRKYAPNDVAVTYERYIKALHRNGNAWGGAASPVDVFNATFMKIREVSITYAVPEVWYKKIGAKSASISAIGQNLFLWAKQFKYSDPDGNHENFSAPSQRFVGFNLRVNF